MSNPFLAGADLPPFDRMQPEHVLPAIHQLMEQASLALETVTAAEFPARWEAIAGVLDVAVDRLVSAWGTVSHLNRVADTPALRAAYNEALPKVTGFWTRLGADQRLYAKYKAIDPSTLNTEQCRAWDNAVRNFVLSGAELQGEAKLRFAQIQQRSSELSQKFSENALDATEAFAYYATAEELEGVPADVQQAARAAAEAEGQAGYKLTLKMPCCLPVLQFARNSGLRETLYKAYVTCASDQAGGDATRFDNSTNIRSILALRLEEAQLLGYAHFADLTLVTEMAPSPAEVITFLRDLARRARPHAEKDVADLRAFAVQELGLADPQPWDWRYVTEKLKQARYAFSEQEVKQYFPAPKVLAGLFKIVESLFEVSIRRDVAPIWNPSVAFYRIERAGANGPELVGQFYLDQPARQGKRDGAWMDGTRTRWLRPDNHQLQTPVAHLVCNFADGVDGKPALLTHHDVITLFHEAGHGLHHLLTQVNEHRISGIRGVEWDAVELPSQFMENFCWEWSVLEHMTAHVDTGEPLPRALFDKMTAAKNFQSGMSTLDQIEYGLFDMLLHTTHQPENDIMPLLAQVRAEVAVLPAPPYSRPAHTLSHIFAGGHAAGYYGYKWAEVLSADAYAAFEETQLPDGSNCRETGRRFRTEILEAGGSRPAMESFKAFRGRAPSLDALLRHQGMAEPA
ncbi:M3 family metallopeptidase [Acidovorax sp. Be4]|uniref:oligopeptidase A n=1 Tax=Acidovorax bellezanensis TaxID=2976702 RepID=A0ABT2PRB0_9BURK|nr:M3 family metallopeptidase [Acidovorax sp. Be4]MCT9811817.1 M3 family metallopeptidase [Acidovorax sp. Be4]